MKKISCILIDAIAHDNGNPLITLSDDISNITIEETADFTSETGSPTKTPSSSTAPSSFLPLTPTATTASQTKTMRRKTIINSSSSTSGSSHFYHMQSDVESAMESDGRFIWGSPLP